MKRAGIIELEIAGKGPKRGYVFDPHRLALPCWAEIGGPSLLLTLDRHFDTVIPQNPPGQGLTVDEYEQHARDRLDHRNYDHVLAAMAAGIISDAIVIARAKPVGAVTSDWQEHEVIASPVLELITEDWGTPHATPEGKRAHAAVTRAKSIIFDVDLDCFTTPSDANPTTVVPWSLELIRDFVKPRGSSDFWNDLLAKCTGFTFAREPSHCGGLIAAGRLFEHASQVIFAELFETDLP